WNVDLFWVQPVLPNRNELDSVDNNQNFFGLWATRKLRPGAGLDFYYLDLDNTNPTAVGRDGVRGGQNVSTLGTRCWGDRDNRWLYDAELMFQVGSYVNQTKVA